MFRMVQVGFDDATKGVYKTQVLFFILAKTVRQRKAGATRHQANPGVKMGEVELTQTWNS